MSKTYRVETDKFVVSVDVDREDNIKHGAYLIRKFYGQPFQNLVNWSKNKFRYCDIKILNESGKFVDIPGKTDV